MDQNTSPNYPPGLVARFDAQKSSFKRQLNNMVDGLFDFFLSEVAMAYQQPFSDPIETSTPSPSAIQVEQPISENIKQEPEEEERQNQFESTNQEPEAVGLPVAAPASMNTKPSGSLSKESQKNTQSSITLKQPEIFLFGPSSSSIVPTVPSIQKPHQQDSSHELYDRFNDSDYHRHQAEEEKDEEEECLCEQCMTAFECNVEIGDDAPKEEENVEEPKSQKRARVDVSNDSIQIIQNKFIIREYNKLPKRFLCTFQNCTQSFKSPSLLKAHERVHKGVRPYLCNYQYCGAEFVQIGAAVTHIRMVHFGLPKSIKLQKELNIVDDRDPNLFLVVRNDLL